MSRTRKPCPGCGKVRNTRPADEVCYVCKEHLRLGQAAQAAADAPEQPRKPYRMPMYLEYIGDTPPDERHALNKALLALLDLIGQPYKGAKFVSNMPKLLPATDGGYRFYDQPAVIFTDDEVRRIRDFWQALDAALLATYEHGRHEGRSLLLGCANGQTSIEDLNGEALRHQKEQQALLNRQERREHIYSQKPNE